MITLGVLCMYFLITYYTALAVGMSQINSVGLRERGMEGGRDREGGREGGGGGIYLLCRSI